MGMEGPWENKVQGLRDYWPKLMARAAFLGLVNGLVNAQSHDPKCPRLHTMVLFPAGISLRAQAVVALCHMRPREDPFVLEVILCMGQYDHQLAS